MTALAGLTVIETACRPAGEFAARLLADFGAEVIKVEPPGGSPTRRLDPIVDGVGVPFRFLNAGKKSIELDLTGRDGRAMLDRLLSRAQALVDDHAPAASPAMGLDRPSLAARHGTLVHCAITPFGQDAPEDWQIARSLNVMHSGGWGFHTPSEAAARDVPLKGAGRFLSDYEAGIDAALCVAASLWRCRSGGGEQAGTGQFIDISEQAVQLSRADCVLGRMLAGEAEVGPERTRYDMGGPGAVFACTDGHVFLVMTTRSHWLGLCRLMGDPAWARDFPEDWLEFHCTPDHVEQFRRHFRPWIADQVRDAVSEAAQKLGVALVQVNTAADLAAHPQYRHRRYFQQLDGLAYPTVPYRMTASPVRLASPAPALNAAMSNEGRAERTQ